MTTMSAAIAEFKRAVENVSCNVALIHKFDAPQIASLEPNEKGAGFLGSVFMVTVTDRKCADKKLDLVLKLALRQTEIRAIVPVRLFYENEIFFYDTIYPTFEQFNRKQRGENAAPLDLVPRNYLNSLLPNAELLVLGNLKAAGFHTFDRKLDMNRSHIEMIFKRYGCYHGTSFAFQDKEPAWFATLTDGIRDGFSALVEVERFSKSLQRLCEFINDKVLVSGEVDQVIIDKFKKYNKDNILDIYLDSINRKSKYLAILHGDCWSNNLMFKYENDSSLPVDMRIIDWQLIALGSPIRDLSYALYSGASKEIFDDLDHYLHVYHRSFSRCVKQLGSEPEELLPFAVLKDEWRNNCRFGLLMAIMLVSVKCADPKDVGALHENDDNEEELKMSDPQKFARRIKELLTHVNELGAL